MQDERKPVQRKARTKGTTRLRAESFPEVVLEVHAQESLPSVSSPLLPHYAEEDGGNAGEP